MDAIEQDLQSRKLEIQEELESLFKANMRVSDYNIPEVDDQKVAEMLVGILQEKLDSIKEDVKAKKYKNY